MSLGRTGRSTGDRLAVVLRLRRLEEDRARAALAAALARRAGLWARLEALRVEHDAGCATLAALLGAGTDAATLAGAAADVEVVERRRAELAGELEAAGRAVGAAQGTLAEATRRRRAVERLRERRLAERRREEERRLERELADLVLVRRAWSAVEAAG